MFAIEVDAAALVYGPQELRQKERVAAGLARALAGVPDIQILVAGTDGTDGPTDAAGAMINGETWEASGADALHRADIYPWLKSRKALFTTGPTGTNVMDLLLAFKD